MFFLPHASFLLYYINVIQDFKGHFNFFLNADFLKKNSLFIVQFKKAYIGVLVWSWILDREKLGFHALINMNLTEISLKQLKSNEAKVKVSLRGIYLVENTGTEL